MLKYAGGYCEAGDASCRYAALRNAARRWHYVMKQHCRTAFDHRRRSDWNTGGKHGGTYYKSPAVEAENTFSYIVMQVGQRCGKFCNMTKSGGHNPPLEILGPLSPPLPVIYAYAFDVCGRARMSRGRTAV